MRKLSITHSANLAVTLLVCRQRVQRQDQQLKGLQEQAAAAAETAELKLPGNACTKRRSPSVSHAVTLLVCRERVQRQKQQLEGLQEQVTAAAAKLQSQAATLMTVEARLAELTALQKVRCQLAEIVQLHQAFQCVSQGFFEVAARS